MHFIQIGDEFINLDNVTTIDCRDVAARIFFVGPETKRWDNYIDIDDQAHVAALHSFLAHNSTNIMDKPATDGDRSLAVAKGWQKA